MGPRHVVADALRYLRPLAVYAAAVLLALSLSRLGIVLWQHERVGAAHMYGMVFVQGLRFDAIVVGMTHMESSRA